MSDIDIIRTFWQGSDLSAYEELSLLSFAKHGHRVQLFSYRPLRDIAGVESFDASLILPESDLFCYKSGAEKGSFAAFANLFRYKLLNDLGGTWVDLDVLCLRPFFSLPSTCVGWQDDSHINTAVMRFPAGHPVVKELYDEARKLGQGIQWGQTGPILLTDVVKRAQHDVTVLPTGAFYPVHWDSARIFLLAGEYERCVAATSESYCLHWWNEIIRRHGLSKDSLPPAGSYLHQKACELLEDHGLNSLSEDGMYTQLSTRSAKNSSQAVNSVCGFKRFLNPSKLSKEMERLGRSLFMRKGRRKMKKSFYARLSVKLACFSPSSRNLSMMKRYNNIQLDVTQMEAISRVVAQKAPCKMLVFGMGYDSAIWAGLNRRGKTLFLESDEEWYRKIVNKHKKIKGYKVDYRARMRDWQALLKNPSSLKIALPEEVENERWDVILVDGPAGFEVEHHGRMESIFQASRLVGFSGDIFVHDCDRVVEDSYCCEYLKRENLAREICGQFGLLRHYEMYDKRTYDQGCLKI
jgi:uncharacterized protein (TIGR01627 family)